MAGGRILWQRIQLLDQSSSPLNPLYESFETPVLDLSSAFRFVLGSANKLQLALTRRKTRIEKIPRVAIMLLFRLETHGGLNKQGVSIRLTVRLIPLIGSFQ